jgi:hypothetical protein
VIVLSIIARILRGDMYWKTREENSKTKARKKDEMERKVYGSHTK